METGLFALLSDMTKNGIIADTTLLLIIIGLMFLAHKHILKPLVARVNTLPTTTDLDKRFNHKIELNEKHVREILLKLDAIEERVRKVEEFTALEGAEFQDFKRDIDLIRTMLNQFQGHMMYGGRRAGDFGNQELK